MTDQQIQENADRAHEDSVAMTAAINAQTEQMKAYVEGQKQLIAAYNATTPDPVTRLSFADLTELTGVLAELMKATTKAP